MDTFMILQINKENANLYIKGIADVHYSAYSKRHFTSCFTQLKLADYYNFLINNSDLSLVSLDDKNQVNGFIIAGCSVGQGVNQFIHANKPYVIKTLITHPNFLLEKMKHIAINKLKRSEKSTSHLSTFRLLSIAVDATTHSKGIGSDLIREFEKILKELNIKAYGLSVKKDNVRAIKFYEKNQFITEKETSDAVYYRKDLL